jgi:hypothetical protein
MNKKQYQKPVVKKVRLVMKNAVLADCHSSPNLTPRDDPTPGAGCLVNPACYTP